jgi:hypothetical protein
METRLGDSVRASATTQARHVNHHKHNNSKPNKHRRVRKVATWAALGAKTGEGQSEAGVKKGKVIAAAVRRSPQIGVIALVIVLIVVVELQVRTLWIRWCGVARGAHVWIHSAIGIQQQRLSVRPYVHTYIHTYIHTHIRPAVRPAIQTSSAAAFIVS